MRCPEQSAIDDAILLDYCAHRLAPEAAAAFERHLANCTHCSECVVGQQQILAALDDWKPHQPSSDFDRRLYEQIEQESRQWWRHLWPAEFGWKPVAAACATVIAVALLSTPGKPPANAVQESSRVEMLEPELVERTLEDLEMLKQLSTSASQKL